MLKATLEKLPRLSRRRRIDLLEEINIFRGNKLDGIVDTIIRDLSLFSLSLDRLECVIASSLRGQFVPGTEQMISGALASWISSTAGCHPQISLAEVVGLLSKRSNDLLVCKPTGELSVEALPLGDVLLCCPALFRVNAQAGMWNRIASVDCRFMVLKCSVAPLYGDDTSQAVQVVTGNDMKTVFGFNARGIERYIRFIHGLTKLRLLVSTEELPYPALGICEELGILALQYVPVDIAETLSSISGIQTVGSLDEIYSLNIDRFIGTAQSVEEVQFDEDTFHIVVKGIKRPRAALHVPQMIVQASSMGVCTQLKTSLIRCLKLLDCCLRHHIGPHVISGGGAFEAFIIGSLEGNSDLTKVLGAALAAPVQCLVGDFQFPLKNSSLRFHECHWSVVDATSIGEALEPLALKVNQLDCLLQTYQQILRIDKVIMV